MSEWPWIRLLSVLVFVLLLCGVVARHRKLAHISLMGTAMAIDVGLVLYLEFARAVVERVATEPISNLMLVHILLSVVVLVLYGVQVYTGIANAKGRRSRTHGRTMPWLLLTRLGSLVTSFFVT